jgi:hypothetical protein
MMNTIFKILQSIPLLVLCYSCMLIWMTSKKRDWLMFCIGANVLAFIFAVIHPFGVIANCLLGYAIFSFYSLQGHLRYLSGVVILFIGYLILSHNLPGVSNVLISKQLELNGYSPFDFYLHFDKIFLGVMILGFSNVTLIKSWQEFIQLIISIKRELTFAVVVLFVISVLASSFHLAPKLPSISLLWILNNLFAGSIGEETFLRVFIQANLFVFLATNHKNMSLVNLILDRLVNFVGFSAIKMRLKNQLLMPAIISIFVTSLIFVSYHAKDGFSYIIMSFIASIFYGWSYYKTSRVEVPILLHFLVNLSHYFLLSYPSLLEG